MIQAACLIAVDAKDGCHGTIAAPAQRLACGCLAGKQLRVQPQRMRCEQLSRHLSFKQFPDLLHVT